MKSGIFLDEIHKAVRKKVSFADKDRVFADDIEKGIEMIQDKTIIKVIEKISAKKGVSLKTKYSEEFEVF
jgi:histidine ammonia-lyase